MKYLFVFLSLIFSSFAHAQGGGHSVGNGGKSLNAFLTDAIVKMDELLMKECAKPESENPQWHRLACKVPEKLFEQIMKTKVMNDYIVYGKLDHKPRDAINDVLQSGEPFVIYSIRNLKLTNPAGRRRILLHEFMTLAGFETSDSYGYSSVVLNFLAQNAEMQEVMKDLPVMSDEQKTFRGREVTIWDGEKTYPVVIQSAADYSRFCVAQGFSHFTSLYHNDVSYDEWMKLNPGHPGGVAILNDDGVLLEVARQPSKQARVMESVTCL